jgi:HSP20 family protein
MVLVPFRSNTGIRQAYDPFSSFRGEFDRLFDNFFTHLPAQSAQNSNLMSDFRIDVSETDQNISVHAELPGVEEKDIDVQLNRDILTVRGEKNRESEEKEKNYHLVERSYGSFARSIRLPFEPKPDAVKANFKNGVLNVMVEKPAATKEEPYKIEVKSA